MYLHKRKKSKKLKNLNKNYVTLLIVIIFLLSISSYLLIFTDFFNVEEIKVTGNNVVTDEEIILKSNLSLNDNILMFNKQDIEIEIEKIIYIKNARIIRRLPNNINIVIEERKPICVIPFEDRFIYVDDQKIILDFKSDLDLSNIPIISGFDNIGIVSIGNPLQLQPLWMEDNVINILITLNKYKLLDRISEVYVDNDKYFSIYTKGGSIIKAKDSDTVISKIDFINTFLTKEDNKMIVDLTYGGNPIYKPRN